jgi:FixJ family two-component response regulator
MESEPKVFVVDDDAGMRKSTGALLAAARLPYQTFDSATAFLADYKPDQPGCVVLDMSMPGMSGMDLVEHLRQAEAMLPILIVSGTGSIPLAVKGMKLGVIDFLEKPVDPETLLTKVRAALDLDAQQRSAAEVTRGHTRRVETLTTRELEVLRCLVRGLSNKQIAAELQIAVKTVDNHRTRAMRKTGALNAADLTRISIAAGLK